MGLFSGLKKQLLSVIKWEEDSKDTVVYKYQLKDREQIMNSSSLVVRESQAAIFMHKGQIADVFGPGTYTLSTDNIPFLTKLLSLPTGFDSRITADVYFVNTRQFTGLKWGTQNPIMMRDADFGTIRLKGFGIYAFKVDDPAKFLKEMFGTSSTYKVDDVASQCKPMLIQGITTAIAKAKISALDLASSYRDFSKNILESTQPEFDAYGLKLTNVTIENLSLPEEVEKVLDERSGLGILEDKIGTYTRLKTAQAIGDAAKNPSGAGLAGLGVGIGAGRAVGGSFASAVSFENPEPKKPAVKTAECTKCGAQIRANAKFCPECGAKQGLTCPKCGEAVTKTAKFCPNCGQSLAVKKTCPKCNAELKANAKFCPECGEKL